MTQLILFSYLPEVPLAASYILNLLQVARFYLQITWHTGMVSRLNAQKIENKRFSFIRFWVRQRALWPFVIERAYFIKTDFVEGADLGRRPPFFSQF